MEKHSRKHSLILILALSYFCFCQDNRFDGRQHKFFNNLRSHRNGINYFIYNLNYRRDEVLVWNGDSDNRVKKEGHPDKSNNIVVINRKRKSVNNEKTEIGVLASIENKSHPGSLLLANYSLINNSPDILSVGHAPLKHAVIFPGLTKDGSFKIVPTFTRYKAAQNDVLTTWFEKYEIYHSFKAAIFTDYSFAFSK